MTVPRSRDCSGVVITEETFIMSTDIVLSVNLHMQKQNEVKWRKPMDNYTATQVEFFDEMSERNEEIANSYDATRDYE